MVGPVKSQPPHLSPSSVHKVKGSPQDSENPFANQALEKAQPSNPNAASTQAAHVQAGRISPEHLVNDVVCAVASPYLQAAEVVSVRSALSSLLESDPTLKSLQRIANIDGSEPT